jgi:hypothetical protein
MSEALATRGEEMRRGPMTADDLARQVADLKRQVEQIKPGVEDRISIIVFSGDLDKVLAAFVIATGAVAMGMEAVMFFTFLGTPVLRDAKKSVGRKDLMGKMFGFMLPKGRNAIKLSKMNIGGWGLR